MLQIGLTGSKALRVTEAHTARAIGSGGLSVFATPAMIALMEATAMESALPHLSSSEGTVGTQIDVGHLAATPVGMTVTCQSKLTAIDGRKLTFAIEVRDEKELVGTAVHVRYVIDTERFMQKASGKLG